MQPAVTCVRISRASHFRAVQQPTAAVGCDYKCGRLNAWELNNVSEVHAISVQRQPIPKQVCGSGQPLSELGELPAASGCSASLRTCSPTFVPGWCHPKPVEIHAEACKGTAVPLPPLVQDRGDCACGCDRPRLNAHHYLMPPVPQ